MKYNFKQKKIIFLGKMYTHKLLALYNLYIKKQFTILYIQTHIHIKESIICILLEISRIFSLYKMVEILITYFCANFLMYLEAAYPVNN